MIEVQAEHAPQEVRDLAERVEQFALANTLRAVKVFDGEWIVNAEEPSILEEPPDGFLKVTIGRVDL